MMRSSFVLLVAVVLATIALVRGGIARTLRYSLQEESERGTAIGNIAVDAGLTKTVPVSELAHLEFSFSSTQHEHQHLFNIDRKTGLMTTAAHVDRDAMCANLDECVVHLAVQVLPARFFTIVKIDVDIVDVNDNSPQFPSDSLRFALTEVSVPGVGLSIPLAEDPDSPKFAVQKYELMSDDDKFDLVVVLEDGIPTDIQLVLRGKLDREQNDVYVLGLVAVDGGMPPKSGSVTVTIDVIDVNDNSPVFENITYMIAILENISPSTVILTVKASDPDSGLSGQVVYSFDRKTQQRYGNLFDINELGEISVTGPIDYEEATYYVLVVSAQNPEPNSSPVRAKVFIEVQDQNDNPPTINVNTLTDDGVAQIPEAAPVGTFVAHMTIVDDDAEENGRFNCSIQTPSFEIRQLYETEFKIMTSALLDREQRAQFVVAIECQDHGITPRFTVEQLTVTIVDENDNAPVFSRSTYAVDVLENGKPETLVVTVSATDADAGRNSHLRYSIPANMALNFAIGATNGQITTQRPFDRERTDEIRFKVHATDNGSPQRTGTADVVISITDVNDEYPRFSRSRYEFEVPENGPEIIAVGHVTAVDGDSDANNKFDYVIDPETNRHELFAIDPVSGAITTTDSLDRELEPSYILRVLAVPVGDAAGADTATVTIYLQDANDNVPVLLFPTTGNETVFISPFTPVHYIIARLLAFDADVGRNGALSYGVNGGAGDNNDYFAVDNATGYVRVAKELLNIDSRTFVLTCIAEDDGVPRQRSMAHLVLVVNSSVAFQVPHPAHRSEHWVATIISLVVISISVLLVVFCAAVVLFIRRRRREAKTNRSTAIVMKEPRHLASKTFAVHVRQVDRCNNDYSQLCENHQCNNEQCGWNQPSKRSLADTTAENYQRNYDPLRPGTIRTSNSRESLRSHDMLCDATNGDAHSADNDETSRSSRVQNTSAPHTTETHLSTGGDRVSESGCSEDSKPDSGRGSFEEATSDGRGSPQRLTALKGRRPHHNTALTFDVRRQLDHSLRDAAVGAPRNDHVQAQATGKKRIRIVSQV